METILGMECGTGHRKDCPNKYTSIARHLGERVGEKLENYLPHLTEVVPHAEDIPYSTQESVVEGDKVVVSDWDGLPTVLQITPERKLRRTTRQIKPPSKYAKASQSLKKLVFHIMS